MKNIIKKLVQIDSTLDFQLQDETNIFPLPYLFICLRYGVLDQAQCDSFKKGNYFQNLMSLIQWMRRKISEIFQCISSKIPEIINSPLFTEHEVHSMQLRLHFFHYQFLRWWGLKFSFVDYAFLSFQEKNPAVIYYVIPKITQQNHKYAIYSILQIINFHYMFQVYNSFHHSFLL